jgi:hypothetical protein
MKMVYFYGKTNECDLTPVHNKGVLIQPAACISTARQTGLAVLGDF